MKLHFICRGNIYRSRLAEAYARYLTEKSEGIDISSSGIESQRALHYNVNPITLEYLDADGLTDYLSQDRRQTTQELLDEADVLVFMNDPVYEDAKIMFDVPEEKSKVWHIPDAPGVYPDIKQNVEKLLNNIGVPEGN